MRVDGCVCELVRVGVWVSEGLQKMLHPHPEALRALYVHEPKMVGVWVSE